MHARFPLLHWCELAIWFVWVGLGQFELAWDGEGIARGNKHNLVIVIVWGGLRMLPLRMHTRLFLGNAPMDFFIFVAIRSPQ